MSGTLKTAEIRARLNHPVIDSDGHFTEYGPILREYIIKTGGKQAVADFAADTRKTFTSMDWHRLSLSERRETWIKRPPFFALPAANTLDLATSLFPDLLYERLDEIGLDFTVLYPGAAIGVQTFFEDDVRRDGLPGAEQLLRRLVHGSSRPDDAGRGNPDAYAAGGN